MKKSKKETELAVVEHFNSTVSTNDEGGFQFKLPLRKPSQ